MNLKRSEFRLKFSVDFLVNLKEVNLGGFEGRDFLSEFKRENFLRALHARSALSPFPTFDMLLATSPR